MHGPNPVSTSGGTRALARRLFRQLFLSRGCWRNDIPGEPRNGSRFGEPYFRQL